MVVDRLNNKLSREILMNNLRWLPDDLILNVKLLASGNPNLSYEKNVNIFKHVFEFIKRSERFLVM